jgi:hypothetical protein
MTFVKFLLKTLIFNKRKKILAARQKMSVAHKRAAAHRLRNTESKDIYRGKVKKKHDKLAFDFFCRLPISTKVLFYLLIC